MKDTADINNFAVHNTHIQCEHDLATQLTL